MSTSMSFRKTSSRKQIAARVREARVEAGLRQFDVAEKFKISPNQWSRIERGLQSIFAERLVEICALLKTTPEHLLGIV